MSSVKITTNFDDINADLLEVLGDLPGSGMRASVWSDLEYAIYTEFGTYKMLPHAMVRNSIPAIEAYFDEQWEVLQEVNANSLEQLFNRVIEFAKDEIVKRTHVDTGALRASWTIDIAEFV